MNTNLDISVILNTSKSLLTSLCQREERSPATAKLVPHFNKGGLGGICIFMSYIPSMIESNLPLLLQTVSHENH